MTEFGDIAEDDGHEAIEAWELADIELQLQGFTDQERAEYWRALDPDTIVLDWHAELVAEGMDAWQAQDYIQRVAELLP